LSLAFITSPLDRAAEIRNSSNRLNELAAVGASCCVAVLGDQVQTEAGQVFIQRGAIAAGSVFLGLDENKTAWFARPAVETSELTGLRDLMLAGDADAGLLSILAQARSMVGWHATHGFCAKCGAATDMADAGYRRHCAGCGADHFPRTDPVVIMAVVEGDAMLLGRQAAWKPGMYSALAGFMEPGETIEQAVAREVREEAGVVVHDACYVACQPWPFPSSLMIGMVAKAASRDLKIDHSEIEDARWFSKTEIRQMLERTHPDNLYAAHPYAIAHRIISAALEEIESAG
jgi:NAD+ diphosphatase